MTEMTVEVPQEETEDTSELARVSGQTEVYADHAHDAAKDAKQAAEVAVTAAQENLLAGEEAVEAAAQTQSNVKESEQILMEMREALQAQTLALNTLAEELRSKNTQPVVSKPRKARTEQAPTVKPKRRGWGY